MNIKEINGYGNIAYLIDDENSFKPNDYKRMKLAENDEFVPCYMDRQNGKLKLIYCLDGLEPLSKAIATLPQDRAMMIIVNLINAVIDIDKQGYLKRDRINLDCEKMFVNMSNWKVKVIYFPLELGFEGASNFESAFSNEIAEIIDLNANIDLNFANNVKSIISNSNLSLLEKRQQIIPLFTNEKIDLVEEQPKSNQPKLTFASVDASTNICFKITEPEFVIGRNPSMVDGYIPDNRTIGKTHCKIVFNNAYYVVDLNSSNGTYINSKRLEPNTPVQINSGDRIRLANSEFVISY